MGFWIVRLPLSSFYYFFHNEYMLFFIETEVLFLTNSQHFLFLTLVPP